MWTVDHDAALNWAFRATADAVFDGVHLDVEPWALPRWPQDARMLMASYATLVEEMTEVAPLAVDIVPWLVDSHREAVSRVVRQCDSLTVLAYRDRAARILDDIRGIQELCVAEATRPNRRRDTAAVVIDTKRHDVRRRRRGGDASGARRGRGTNTAAVVRRVRRSSPRLLANDAPVTVYSRPADTQLMSWNRFPDTAVAAVQRAELICRQLHRQRPQVLLDAGCPPGAGNRYGCHAQCLGAITQPRQRNLGGAPAASATDFTTSTTARLASSASPLNRGMVRRKSLCEEGRRPTGPCR